MQCPKVPNSVNNECQTIRNFTGLGAHRDLLVDADEEPDVAAPDSALIAVPRGGADGKPTGKQPFTDGTPATLRWPVSRM